MDVEASHLYVDDSETHPSSLNLPHMSKIKTSTHVSDFFLRMWCPQLKLNKDNTVILFIPNIAPNYLLFKHCGGTTILPIIKVPNQGLTFNLDFCPNIYIKFKSCRSFLYHITQIWPFPPFI